MSMWWRSVVAVALVLVTACQDVTSNDEGRPARLTPTAPSQGLIPVTGSCANCVFGPRVISKSRPSAQTFDGTFSGDPAADYMLVVKSSDPTARVEAWLNGVKVMSRGALEMAAGAEATQQLTVQSKNVLVMTLYGQEGVSATVAVVGGTKSIGPNGGTVAAPGGLARVTIEAGVLSTSATVRIATQVVPPPTHRDIGTGGVRVIVTGITGQVLGNGNITLELPVKRAPTAAATPTLRASFPGVSNEPVWRDATFDGSRMTVKGVGSATAFFQQTPIQGDSVAIDLSAEEYQIPSPGTFARSSSARPMSSISGVLSVVCSLSPFSSLTQLYGLGLGDGSAPSIWHDASGPALATARNAIVLVHGWSRNQTDCDEYRSDERVDQYFAALRASLGSAASGLAGVPILMVDYPTFNHFSTTGQELAVGLNAIQQRYGLNLVIVAHSMGGLVAREAARSMTKKPLGIITLDTPHLGSPAASNTGFWSWAQNSPALAGLLSGLSHDTSEPPIVAYGSRTTFTVSCLGRFCQYSNNSDPNFWRATKYTVPGRWLCAGGDCVNDGIVPDWSSLPSFVATPDQRPFTGFDHSFMKGDNGTFPPGVESSIVADLKRLLNASSPNPPTAIWHGTTRNNDSQQSMFGAQTYLASIDFNATTNQVQSAACGNPGTITSKTSTQMTINFPGCGVEVLNYSIQNNNTFIGQGTHTAQSGGRQYTTWWNLNPRQLAFSDDFSNNLGNWTVQNPDGLGSWSTPNSELIGDYNISCGGPSCNHTQLLLADALQPGSGNWRMEVQSNLVQAYCCYNGGAVVSFAKFVLWISNAQKEAIDVGYWWQGLTAPSSHNSVMASHESFPWVSIGNPTLPTVLPWSPTQWQTGVLEKHGNTYTVYFNGQQIYSTTRTFPSAPKIGFSTYGKVRMDNFKLYTLP